MKNIKFSVLFLLLPLISSFSCQSFGNFGAGFVINLEGDFDRDAIIKSQLFFSYQEKNQKLQAQINLTTNKPLNGLISYTHDSEFISLQADINITKNNITPNIKACPISKPYKNINNNTATILYASATNIAIESLAAICHKELERKRACQYEDHYEKRCIEEIEKGDILFKQAEKDLYHV